MNALERMIMWLSPSWARARAQSRLVARHYDAADVGRRTSGWRRKLTDASAATGGPALAYLRAQARDLVRNNPWARRGIGDIAMDTVGWGIKPKAMGRRAERVMELWKKWGETTDCDAQGRLTFYGLQYLAMRAVIESGEVLIRRRYRRPEDGLAIPMQLQILEPDHIDTSKDAQLKGGGKIVQGIEFDAIGRRVAYWLFDEHPGGSRLVVPVSRRVPSDGVLHIYDMERPGQIRGPSWFASVDVRLHGFDEYEDATLMKQKIAACMAAFVKDLDGAGDPLAKSGTDAASGQPTDTFEPGMIVNLPPGKDVTVANPPQATDYAGFSTSQLRGVAAGIGYTYEGLTGDYSQVNYSSARMGANKYRGRLHHWRWNMLIPQFCAPAWIWMLQTLDLVGEPVDLSPAEWTPPPMPMLDPDKEAAATTRMIRGGQMTHDQMVLEQGYDPDQYWKDYAAALKRLDELGIVLDSDPRRTNNSGQAQATADSTAEPATNGVAKNGAKPAAGTDSYSA